MDIIKSLESRIKKLEMDNSSLQQMFINSSSSIAAQNYRASKSGNVDLTYSLLGKGKIRNTVSAREESAIAELKKMKIEQKAIKKSYESLLGINQGLEEMKFVTDNFKPGEILYIGMLLSNHRDDILRTYFDNPGKFMGDYQSARSLKRFFQDLSKEQDFLIADASKSIASTSKLDSRNKTAHSVPLTTDVVPYTTKNGKPKPVLTDDELYAIFG